MKTPHVLSFFVLFFLCSSSQAETQSQTLFQFVDESPWEERELYVFERSVRLSPYFSQDSEPLVESPAGIFRIPFPEEQPLHVLWKSWSQISESEWIAEGALLEDPLGSVSFVKKNSTWVGMIRFGRDGGSLELFPEENSSLYRLQYHSPNAESFCADEKEHSARPSLVPENSTPFAPAIIDMLVAYTPEARQAKGGTSAIQALIRLGIEDTNRAFIDSGVNVQVRLAGTLEVRQNDSRDFYADLPRLRGGSDGQWDEIHAERNRLGADQVTLVGYYAGSPYAGLASTQLSSYYALSLVRVDSFSYFSFSHELGHNIGLRHDDGYVNTSSRFKTIMAYGNYSRIRRFSSPTRTYNGRSTGNSSHNSASILNRNAPTVSQYR